MEEVNYIVEIGTGTMYTEQLKVKAFDEQDALERVVAQCEKDGLWGLIYTEGDLSELELDEEEFMYIDATSYGASEPYYIDMASTVYEDK